LHTSSKHTSATGFLIPSTPDSSTRLDKPALTPAKPKAHNCEPSSTSVFVQPALTPIKPTEHNYTPLSTPVFVKTASSLVTTPSGSKRKRKFPGPAGVLPKLVKIFFVHFTVA